MTARNQPQIRVGNRTLGGKKMNLVGIFSPPIGCFELGVRVGRKKREETSIKSARLLLILSVFPSSAFDSFLSISLISLGEMQREIIVNLDYDRRERDFGKLLLSGK